MGNVPRRLARFYRKGEAPQENMEQSAFSPTQKELFEEEGVAPNGRPLLQEIPSMGYEDLNSKNYEEIKKNEQSTLEQKLALQEVQKFKQQNNRMPTEKEADQIAETIFNQLKNSDMNALYPESENSPQAQTANSPQQGRERGRHGRKEEIVKAVKGLNEEALNSNPMQGIPKDDNKDLSLEMKGLLGEAPSPGKKQSKKSDDEFDLGIDSDLEGSSGEETTEITEDDNIEDISLDDKEECPNCKKQTEQVVYCPKCGTAFCENCGKKQGAEYTCPKCQTKTKA